MVNFCLALYSIALHFYLKIELIVCNVLQTLIKNPPCVVSGLIKLRELVRNEHDVDVYLRQVTPDSYRRVLKEIKAKEIYNLVVDTRPENMQHFLKGVNTLTYTHKTIKLTTQRFPRNPFVFQILQLQMNDYKYHYLFTTFVSCTYSVTTNPSSPQS
jgi:transglutaminase/protease-like cytokinesis protein 3